MDERTEPTPGSTWRHYNGNLYRVIHIANEPDDDRYPKMVIYQGVNGRIWARRADDWHRSMILLEQVGESIGQGAEPPC